MDFMETKHSEKYIDDSRIDWWDPSFIKFIGHNLGFEKAKKVCDLGAGAGHWAETLFRSFGWSETDLTLVDSDAGWVEIASLNKRLKSLCRNVTVLKADALNSGVQDHAFDLVTCQTLALHLSDPKGLIVEMMRLCSPGGAVLLSEPVNVLNRCQIAESISYLSPSESALLLKVWHSYHRGVLLESGLNYDIALELFNIIESAGVDRKKISIFRNPRPTFYDIGSESLADEYDDFKFQRASQAGITLEEWNLAKEISLKICRAKNRVITFSNGLFLFHFNA